MSNLFIMNAQLNPKGKATAGVNPGVLLLLNEWVEIENFGSQAVPLSDISVSHKFLDKNRRKTPFRESFWTGENCQEFLQPMQRLRIHSGNVRDYNITPGERTEFLKGFANRQRFIFNNQFGGAITVSWTDNFGRRESMRALYDADQMEGAIHRIHGGKLVPNRYNWLAMRLPSCLKPR